MNIRNYLILELFEFRIIGQLSLIPVLTFNENEARVGDRGEAQNFLERRGEG